MSSTEDHMTLVGRFHQAFGSHMSDEPRFPPLGGHDLMVIRSYAHELADLGRHLKAAALLANQSRRQGLGLLLIRLQLLTEETAELAQAMSEQDMVEALDALTDISYVLSGTYLTLGLQAYRQAADEIVHSSNMSKLGADGRPMVDGSGRVVKGPLYESPKGRLQALLGQ